MTLRKLMLGAFIGALAAFVIGWVLGSWGKFSVQKALDDAELQVGLTEARALVLEARVSLYELNYGHAARRLEAARMPLRRVRERVGIRGQPAVVGQIEHALRQVEEAQRLAGQLDRAAHGRIADAVRVLDEVLAALGLLSAVRGSP